MATRRERVVLELQDDFTGPMIRAAGAAAALNAEMDSLSKRSVNTKRSMSDIDRQANSMGQSLDNAAKSASNAGGGMGVLATAAVTLGTALTPIGASLVPILAGVTNQLGFAALGAGTAILAFHGIGTALKALDTYQLTPTAANLAKLNVEFEKIGPAGADFVKQLEAMKPLLASLQQSAQAGLFPGLTQAISSLETRVPQLQAIIFTVAQTMGDLVASGGKSLAGPAWTSFFNAIETEAKPALLDLGHALGNTALALANLWQAFIPLSNDFGSGLVKMTADFEKWSASLAQTKGFHDFVDYIHQSGPQVAAALGAIGNMLVQIVKASAPLGGVVLQTLTALANIIAKLADSPLGTPIFAAITAISLFTKVLQPAIAGMEKFGLEAQANLTKAGTGFKSLSSDLVTVQRAGLAATRSQAGFIGPLTKSQVAAENLRGSLVKVGTGAAVLGGVALMASGATEKLNLTNTATLALAGSMLGPFGAGAGALLGQLFDMKAEAAATAAQIDQLGASLRAALAAGDPSAIHSAANAIFAKTDLIPKNLPGPLANNGNVKNLQALSQQAKVANEVATSDQILASSTAGVGQAAGLTAAQVNTLTNSMNAQRKAALGAFDAETQWRTALVAAEKQAAASNAGIRGSSAAALANRAAISGLAAAWNNQSDAVKNNSTRFDEARSAFIRTAVAMGVPIAQARALAKSLLDIPKTTVVKIEAGTASALAAIRRIKAEMASIPKSVQTQYYVNQVNRLGKGPVTGPGSHATGGYISGPGTGTSDSIPARLSNGEFVMNAAATKRLLPWLQAENAKGYAAGGLAMGPWALPQFSGLPGIWASSFAHQGQQEASLTAAMRDLNKAIATQTAELKGTKGADRKHREQQIKDLRAQLAKTTALQSAVSGFSLAGVLPQTGTQNPIWAGVKAQLDTLEKAFRTAGGTWTGALEHQSKKMLTEALTLDVLTRKGTALSTSLTAQKQATDSLRQTMTQFGDSVAANFRTGLFGATNSTGGPQAASVTGILAALTKDATDATKFNGLLTQLAGEGLSSGILQELGAKGDVASATALASASASDIAAINAASKARDAALAALSTGSANDVYGTQFAVQMKAQAASQAAFDANTKAIATLTAALAAQAEPLQDKVINVYLDGKKVGHGVYPTVVAKSQKQHRTNGLSGIRP